MLVLLVLGNFLGALDPVTFVDIPCMAHRSRGGAGPPGAYSFGFRARGPGTVVCVCVREREGIGGRQRIWGGL